MTKQDDELVARLRKTYSTGPAAEAADRLAAQEQEIAELRATNILLRGQAKDDEAEIAELREELAAAKMGEPEDMVRALQPLAAWVATLKPQLEKAEADDGAE